MRGFSFSIAASALCAAFSILAEARAAGPVVLEPSSQWNLDYAANKCRLARTFGADDNLHILFFETSGPSDTFGMTAAGPSFKRFRSKQNTELTFGPGESSRTTQPFAGDVEEYGTAVIYSSLSLGEKEDDGDEFTLGDFSTGLPEIDTQLADGVDRISLKQRGKEIVLTTGNMKAPFAALNTCSQDLLKDWGLDLERHRTALSRPEWLNWETVVKSIQSSYPSRALRKGEQGIVRMRVIVSDDGRVEECHVDAATETESLESPACQEMAKATFEPARDANGFALRSYYMTSIVYQVSGSSRSATGSRINR